MKLALHPYVSAGVVVTGAGLIVAATIGQSAPQTQTRELRLVDNVADFAAGQDYPITDWEGAYSDTLSNVQDLQSQMDGNPDPIISQIENNLTTYANDLATGFQNSSENLTSDLQDLEKVLSISLSDLQSGDLYDASTNLSNWLLETPFDVTRPIVNAESEIIQSMVNNFDNVVNPQGLAYGDFTSDSMTVYSVPLWFSDLATASLYGPNAAEYALSGVTQDIINALQAGDTTLALNDLVNAPSTIVDAFFNGYDGAIRALISDAAFRGTGLDSGEGLLNGGLENVRQAEEIIAGDLGGMEKIDGTLGAATAAAGSTSDLSAVTSDVSALLNADPALGDLVTALDPNAVADISSLLSLF
jgi:hypothetical protein